MANLAGTDYENAPPMDSFDPVPPGEYRAIAVANEWKETKSGTGEYLNITWELLDEPYQKRRIWTILNLKNSNTTARDIARRELKSISDAFGFAAKDFDEYHGTPIILVVKTETRKDTGESSNRVKGYKPLNGTAGHKETPASKQSGGLPWQRAK